MQGLRAIYHQQVDDRQDDHDDQKAVDPDLGPLSGGQSCGKVCPDGASQSQRHTCRSVHLAARAEAQEALKADDEQDEGLHGVAVFQVVAGQQDQGGENQEAGAEDDQACVDADGEVSGSLEGAERTDRSFPCSQWPGLARSSPRTRSRPATTTASRTLLLSSTAASEPTEVPRAMRAAILTPSLQSTSPSR